MEDYIYIILFIGWMCFTQYIYCSSKEKQEQLKSNLHSLPPAVPDTIMDETSQRSVLKDIFRDFYDEGTEEASVSEPFMVKVKRNHRI